MEQIIPKEELDRLIKIKGEARGTSIKNTADFILKEEGKKGLDKLEETMAGLGYPIKYKEIKPGDFYPLSWLGLTFALIERLFNYDDRKFQELGEFRARFSLYSKIFIKFFISIDKAIQSIPKMWRKSFSVGRIKVAEYNKEKKYLALKLENFLVHPAQCQTSKAIFSNLANIIIKNKVTCEETKCPFRGDEYHEFLLKW